MLYMSNQEILEIALKRPAIECNCRPEDFLSMTANRCEFVKEINH